MRVRVAGQEVAFVCPTDALARTIADLLVNHLGPGRTASHAIRVELRVDEDCPPGTAVCDRTPAGRGGGCWGWTISPGTACDLPNRLYYWAILPILVRVLLRRGILGLHAALLYAPWSGPILMLGASGAGKSTTAAGWAAAGGVVLGDDRAFLRRARGRVSCHGLRRPLHLTPEVIGRLGELPGLEAAVPYLPGRSEVGYDLWQRAGAPVVDRVGAPAIVLVSGVASRPYTRVAPLDPPGLRRSFRRAASPDGEEPPVPLSGLAPYLDVLGEAIVARVTWGGDVWRHPLRHAGVLRDLFGATGAAGTLSSASTGRRLGPA